MLDRSSEIVVRRSGWVIGTVIAADQITKYFARKNFSAIENSSLPFGLDLGLFNLFVVLLVFVLFIFLSWKHFSRDPGFALVVGGAISNLLDRVTKGTVTDFIYLSVGTINFADAAIWLGIVLLCYRFKKSIPQR